MKPADNSTNVDSVIRRTLFFFIFFKDFCMAIKLIGLELIEIIQIRKAGNIIKIDPNPKLQVHI